MLNMAPTDQETEVVPPAEVPEDLPLPSDRKVIFLGGLFVLAVLAAAYVASESFCHWSLLSFSSSCYSQPCGIGAVARTANTRGAAAILALFGTIVGLGTAISGPARTWAAKLPEGIPRLEERLSFMKAPSIHWKGFYSRWKTLANGTIPERRLSRREVQLF